VCLVSDVERDQPPQVGEEALVLAPFGSITAASKAALLPKCR
jgi:hypothetical protein